MISHNNKKRTWHRAAALLLSASLLLTACGAQNNNDNIFSPILPDNSPASSTDPDDKLPDPVTIVVEDDSVAPAEGMVRSRLTNEWVDADVAATRPIAVMIPKATWQHPPVANVLFAPPCFSTLFEKISPCHPYINKTDVGSSAVSPDRLPLTPVYFLLIILLS